MTTVNRTQSGAPTIANYEGPGDVGVVEGSGEVPYTNDQSSFETSGPQGPSLNPQDPMALLSMIYPPEVVQQLQAWLMSYMQQMGIQPGQVGVPPTGGQVGTVPGADGTGQPQIFVDPNTGAAYNAQGQQVDPTTGEPVYPTPTGPTDQTQPTEAPTTEAPTTEAPPDPEAEADAEFLKHCKALQGASLTATGAMYSRGYGMGMISNFDKETLERLSKDEKQPGVVRDAAKYMLDDKNKERFERLETGRGDTDADGNVSLDDLEDEIKRLESEQRSREVEGSSSTEFLTALETMKEYKADFDRAGSSGMMSQDDKFSMKDIDAILKPENKDKFPEEVIKAAEFFKANSNLWDMMDVSAEGGDKDGTVSLEDFNSIYDQVKKSAQPAPTTQAPTGQAPSTVSQLTFPRTITG